MYQIDLVPWETNWSIIQQLDGNVSISSSNQESEKCNSDSDNTEYDTDQEIEPIISPIKVTHNKQTKKASKASTLPLTAVCNARSLYNKNDNFKRFLTELGIEVAVVSETWERRNFFLQDLLKLTNHKIVSYYRPLSNTEKQIGGGAAVVYSENRFEVVPTSVCVPKGVEACWLVIRLKSRYDTIKNIAICSVYVSPSSKHKTDLIADVTFQHKKSINFMILSAMRINLINLIIHIK